MARQALSFPALPITSIAHGDPLPNEGTKRAYAWSTTENDLVIWNGAVWQKAGAGVASKLYALSNIGPGAYFATADGGGEPGLATNFGAVTGVRVNAFPPTATRSLIHRTSTGLGGWLILITAPNDIRGRLVGSNGTVYSSPVYTLTPQDIGRALLVAFWVDSGKLRLAVNRQQVADGVAAPLTIQTFSGPSLLSSTVATALVQNVDVLFGFTFRGAATNANIESIFDAVRTLGDAPTTLPPEAGDLVLSHRWSVKDALAGQVVTPGQVAPATLPDTVTGAAVDAMTRVGSPTIAEIDVAAINRRRSYGVLGYSTTSRLESADGAGIRGSAAGWIAIPIIFRANTGVGYIAHCADPSVVRGWSVYRSVADLCALAGYGSGALLVRGAGAVTPVLGIPSLVHVVWRTGSMELYLNGALLSSDALAYVPHPTEKLIIGQRTDSMSPAASETVYGIAGGTGAPSAADILANYQAFLRVGGVPVLAGVDHSYDFTLDIAAGGPDAGVPAQILDRIGTDHLTRVGTGLQVSRRTERVWNYETTPITYGASNWTDAAYYQSSGSDLAGAITGKSVAMLVRVESQTVTSRSRDVFSLGALVASGTRLAMRMSGSNSSMITYWYNGATQIAAPAIPIASADVGKLLLWVGVWDPAAQKVRAYNKRAEVSTGTNMTAFDPGSTGMVRLGNVVASGVTNFNAENVTILGCQIADVAWSLAEVHALHDAVISEEDMVQVPGSGRSAHLWSVKRDLGVSPTALPATLTDRVGTLNFALQGTPTLKPIHTRAFAW